jgi:hypothetical protein
MKISQLLSGVVSEMYVSCLFSSSTGPKKQTTTLGSSSNHLDCEQLSNQKIPI